ncbi:hypothetical protein [Herbiconiux solani]|uniref:hypothetical protein n=1 Tax=Herbiconiux solani TaxID=661329 RepID=UPI0008255F93|nr:hypothetical protein [Herbiconiux solani]
MVVFVAGVAGWVLGMLLVAQLALTAMKPTCYQEGPFVPGAVAPESSAGVSEALSLAPIGRVCSWVVSEAGVVVTVQSGSWATTGLAYGLVGGGFAALVALGFTKRAE